MTDSCIVEKDYGTDGGEKVDEEGIPVIDCAAEVVQEEERRAVGRADSPVSQLAAVAGAYEEGFGCLDC